MSGVVALDAARHADVRLKVGLADGRSRYARLGLSEIVLACADYPICFAKDAATGRFNLIALLSLDEPRNLFWLGGAWQATYVPQAATTAPFVLDPASPFGLAVDEASPMLGNEGSALFDAQGRPADLLSDVLARLQGLLAEIAAAQAMVDRFAELGLIRPLALRLTREGGSRHEIEGLYTLGPQALASLGDDAITELYRAGYLAAAAIIAASLNQLERLRQLHRASARIPFDAVDAVAAED